MKADARILDDRVKFKLYAARFHLEYLGVIERRRIKNDSLASTIERDMHLEEFLFHLVGAKDALLHKINKSLKLGLRSEEVVLECINIKLKEIGKKKIIRELNVASAPSGWLWGIGEFRNPSAHGERIRKAYGTHITKSKKISIALIPRKKNESLQEELIPYLECSLLRMQELTTLIANRLDPPPPNTSAPLLRPNTKAGRNEG